MSVVGQVWCAPWSVKEESMAMLRNQERTPKEKRNTPTLYVLHLLMSYGCMKVLVTGGGAFNTYLISLFKSKLQGEGFDIEIADRDTIIFKEALIFAFLGLRCLLNQENIMSSVTGSKCPGNRTTITDRTMNTSGSGVALTSGYRRHNIFLVQKAT
jgi:hypothetical protein